VIRTHELAAAPFAFGDHGAAVPANRRQDVDAAVLVTHHDQRLTEQRNRVKVTGIRDLIDAPDAKPLTMLPAKNRLDFARVPFGRDITPAWERRGLRKRAPAGDIFLGRKQVRRHRSTFYSILVPESRIAFVHFASSRRI
jgi:hypothetical protein